MKLKESYPVEIYDFVSIETFQFHKVNTFLLGFATGLSGSDRPARPARPFGRTKKPSA